MSEKLPLQKGNPANPNLILEAIELERQLLEQNRREEIFEKNLITSFNRVIGTMSTVEEELKTDGTVETKRAGMVSTAVKGVGKFFGNIGGLFSGEKNPQEVVKEAFQGGKDMARFAVDAGVRFAGNKINVGSSTKDNFLKGSSNFESVIPGFTQFVKEGILEGKSVNQIIDELASKTNWEKVGQFGKDQGAGVLVFLQQLMQSGATKGNGEKRNVTTGDVKDAILNKDAILRQTLVQAITKVVQDAKIQTQVFSQEGNEKATEIIVLDKNGKPVIINAVKLRGIAWITSFASRRVFLNPFVHGLATGPLGAAYGVLSTAMFGLRQTKEAQTSLAQTINTLALSGFSNAKILEILNEYARNTENSIGEGKKQKIPNWAKKAFNVVAQGTGMHGNYSDKIIINGEADASVALNQLIQLLQSNDAKQKAQAEAQVASIINEMRAEQAQTPEGENAQAQEIESYFGRKPEPPSEILGKIKSWTKQNLPTFSKGANWLARTNWYKQATKSEFSNQKYKDIARELAEGLIDEKEAQKRYQQLRNEDIGGFLGVKFLDVINRPDLTLKLLTTLASTFAQQAVMGVAFNGIRDTAVGIDNLNNNKYSETIAQFNEIKQEKIAQIKQGVGQVAYNTIDNLLAKIDEPANAATLPGEIPTVQTPTFQIQMKAGQSVVEALNGSLELNSDGKTVKGGIYKVTGANGEIYNNIPIKGGQDLATTQRFIAKNLENSIKTGERSRAAAMAEQVRKSKLTEQQNPKSNPAENSNNRLQDPEFIAFKNETVNPAIAQITDVENDLKKLNTDAAGQLLLEAGKLKTELNTIGFLNGDDLKTAKAEVEAEVKSLLNKANELLKEKPAPKPEPVQQAAWLKLNKVLNKTTEFVTNVVNQTNQNVLASAEGLFIQTTTKNPNPLFEAVAKAGKMFDVKSNNTFNQDTQVRITILGTNPAESKTVTYKQGDPVVAFPLLSAIGITGTELLSKTPFKVEVLGQSEPVVAEQPNTPTPVETQGEKPPSLITFDFSTLYSIDDNGNRLLKPETSVLTDHKGKIYIALDDAGIISTFANGTSLAESLSKLENSKPELPPNSSRMYYAEWKNPDGSRDRVQVIDRINPDIIPKNSTLLSVGFFVVQTEPLNQEEIRTYKISDQLKNNKTGEKPPSTGEPEPNRMENPGHFGIPDLLHNNPLDRDAVIRRTFGLNTMKPTETKNTQPANNATENPLIDNTLAKTETTFTPDVLYSRDTAGNRILDKEASGNLIVKGPDGNAYFAFNYRAKHEIALSQDISRAQPLQTPSMPQLSAGTRVLYTVSWQEVVTNPDGTIEKNPDGTFKATDIQHSKSFWDKIDNSQIPKNAVGISSQLLILDTKSLTTKEIEINSPNVITIGRLPTPERPNPTTAQAPTQPADVSNSPGSILNKLMNGVATTAQDLRNKAEQALGNTEEKSQTPAAENSNQIPLSGENEKLRLANGVGNQNPIIAKALESLKTEHAGVFEAIESYNQAINSKDTGKINEARAKLLAQIKADPNVGKVEATTDYIKAIEKRLIAETQPTTPPAETKQPTTPATEPKPAESKTPTPATEPKPATPTTERPAAANPLEAPRTKGSLVYVMDIDVNVEKGSFVHEGSPVLDVTKLNLRQADIDVLASVENEKPVRLTGTDSITRIIVRDEKGDWRLADPAKIKLENTATQLQFSQEYLKALTSKEGANEWDTATEIDRQLNEARKNGKTVDFSLQAIYNADEDKWNKIIEEKRNSTNIRERVFDAHNEATRVQMQVNADYTEYINKPMSNGYSIKQLMMYADQLLAPANPNLTTKHGAELIVLAYAVQDALKKDSEGGKIFARALVELGSKEQPGTLLAEFYSRFTDNGSLTQKTLTEGMQFGEQADGIGGISEVALLKKQLKILTQELDKARGQYNGSSLNLEGDGQGGLGYDSSADQNAAVNAALERSGMKIGSLKEKVALINAMNELLGSSTKYVFDEKGNLTEEGYEIKNESTSSVGPRFGMADPLQIAAAIAKGDISIGSLAPRAEIVAIEGRVVAMLPKNDPEYAELQRQAEANSVVTKEGFFSTSPSALLKHFVNESLEERGVDTNDRWVKFATDAILSQIPNPISGPILGGMRMPELAVTNEEKVGSAQSGITAELKNFDNGGVYLPNPDVIAVGIKSFVDIKEFNNLRKEDPSASTIQLLQVMASRNGTPINEEEARQAANIQAKLIIEASQNPELRSGIGLPVEIENVALSINMPISKEEEERILNENADLKGYLERFKGLINPDISVGANTRFQLEKLGLSGAEAQRYMNATPEQRSQIIQSIVSFKGSTKDVILEKGLKLNNLNGQGGQGTSEGSFVFHDPAIDGKQDATIFYDESGKALFLIYWYCGNLGAPIEISANLEIKPCANADFCAAPTTNLPNGGITGKSTIATPEVIKDLTTGQAARVAETMQNANDQILDLGELMSVAIKAANGTISPEEFKKWEDKVIGGIPFAEWVKFQEETGYLSDGIIMQKYKGVELRYKEVSSLGLTYLGTSENTTNETVVLDQGGTRVTQYDIVEPDGTIYRHIRADHKTPTEQTTKTETQKNKINIGFSIQETIKASLGTIADFYMLRDCAELRLKMEQVAIAEKKSGISLSIPLEFESRTSTVKVKGGEITTVEKIVRIPPPETPVVPEEAPEETVVPNGDITMVVPTTVAPPAETPGETPPVPVPVTAPTVVLAAPATAPTNSPIVTGTTQNSPVKGSEPAPAPTNPETPNSATPTGPLPGEQPATAPTNTETPEETNPEEPKVVKTEQAPKPTGDLNGVTVQIVDSAGQTQEVPLNSIIVNPTQMTGLQGVTQVKIQPNGDIIAPNGVIMGKVDEVFSQISPDGTPIPKGVNTIKLNPGEYTVNPDGTLTPIGTTQGVINGTNGTNQPEQGNGVEGTTMTNPKPGTTIGIDGKDPLTNVETQVPPVQVDIVTPTPPEQKTEVKPAEQPLTNVETQVPPVQVDIVTPTPPEQKTEVKPAEQPLTNVETQVPPVQVDIVTPTPPEQTTQTTTTTNNTPVIPAQQAPTVNAIGEGPNQDTGADSNNDLETTPFGTNTVGDGVDINNK